MAENQEQAKPKEREIPVFTVLKNNCILKNIFLLDNPPSISSSPSPFPVSENVDQGPEIEEILIVGRHPDCNIKLEHPSISRFHLRIHSKPSSRSLYVTDLSSVHGTSISGKRIERGVRMKLNEGDRLQLGVSSRLYRLNWVPLSCAYDMDNPFVPQLDAADTVEEETDEPIDQHKNILFDINDQFESLNDNLEGLERLFLNEDLKMSMQKTSPATFTEDELENEKENGSPSVDHLEASEILGMNSDKKPGSHSIWSRRGKSESVQIETSCLRVNSARINTGLQVKKLFLDENHESQSDLKFPDYEQEYFTPDKENASPNSILFRSFTSESEEKSKNKPILYTPLSSSVDKEEEIFTPDKENMTPNTRLFRSVKNAAVKKSSSYRSSPLKMANKSSTYQDEASQARKVFQELKSENPESKRHGSSKKETAMLKNRANRVPFRPLPVSSPSDNKTESKPLVCEDNTTKVAENRWIIVVDTACLLNKKSRNELQLLRGLRGTTLVIPSIVVRELDCMLRRGGLFTRTSEYSAALQFIEECMAVAKWWVHVQSSSEEGRLVPPTPPASSSPRWMGEDVWTSSIGLSTPLSPCSLQEIVTPTAADHILDYALYYKRIRKDGQLVLLSDDVTLKIKAMAEGVLCETAQEFRRSLVNPFSARFLYSNCSPVGRTWSCEDDIVLKEKYYPSPSKKISKSGEGGVKGLKLILMHNSSFRQIKPVVS
ncbi:hypothetical protein CASFOL_016342 [Castilleja foliolosa]|uniref:FHA domain-containing protein n=1 Tax=Castilleja foliolosa TaxID=1961234 RepID=A0ABD3DJU3_9LAMI